MRVRSKEKFLTIGLALVALLLSGASGSGLAAKGGKPGGGGGGEPPPDPAIVYVTNAGQRQDVRKMDADGGNDTLIHRNVPGRVNARWSADASQIVMKAAFDGFGVYVSDADGANLSQLATTSGQWGTRPAWAPGPSLDGETWILFNDHGPNSPAGNDDLFCVRPDGTGRFNLTDTPEASEELSAWSPEADRVVVEVSHHDEWGDWVHDLYVLDLGYVGGSLVVVSETCLTEDGPLSEAGTWFSGGVTWAKTQNLIAAAAFFADDPTAEWDIWVIDLADPANPTNLTASQAGDCKQPTFSSDDSQIAYNHQGSIWVMSATGASLQLLREGAVKPDWKR